MIDLEKHGKVVKAAGVILLLVLFLLGNRFLAEWHREKLFPSFGADSGLSVAEHRGRPNGNVFEILGTVANEGPTSWRSVTLRADLFDAQGTFVDQCGASLRAPLVPGASEYFKIVCGGCDDRKLPEFETYRVRVVDASGI